MADAKAAGKEHPDSSPPDVACDIVYGVLNESAVRREVLDLASEKTDNLSMMEIHIVMDSLIAVLKGENDV
jgi:hypothetical protein